MRIIFDEKVEASLYELIEVLYHEGYFGFYDTAVDYVRKLVKQIETTIHLRAKRRASPFFTAKYGRNLLYIILPKNQNTTWYVFFHKEDDIFYIRYVGNNHSCGQYL